MGLPSEQTSCLWAASLFGPYGGASRGISLTTAPDLQLMQLLTEAPAIALNPRDGVVAEVQLVQGCEAVEGAAVHFHQAVVLQVPTKTTHRMRRMSSSHYTDGIEEASLCQMGQSVQRR